MTIIKNIEQLIDNYACCHLAAIPISQLPVRERSYFNKHMIGVRTAITLAHHISRTDEYRWYAKASGLEHCQADDHLKEVCEKIKMELMQSGYHTEIVKYPAESGLQFRYVAEASGIGCIGTNACLFHPQWGPWVHLRVMATEIEFAIRPTIAGNQFCNECGQCILECPAGAISEDTFSGKKCRSYRENQGEYIPFGESREYRYCLRCLLICPMGQIPNGPEG
jgi:epoxyqueuosine reductase QueG